MKTHHIKPRSKTSQGLLSLTLGLTLLGSAGAVQAADLLVGNFDTDISALGFQNWQSFSYVTSGDAVWDGAQDADGNAGSGSLYITADWPQSPNWNTAWHDIQFFLNAASPYTIQDYLTVEADIKIDVANSSLSTGGASYGISGLYLNGGDSGWKQIVGFNVLKVTNGWQHISGSLAGVTGSNYNQIVVGLISQNTHALTNSVKYWVDNVRLIGPPSLNTNRPPLSLAKPPPTGLTCMASAPTDPWQRQMVRTTNSSYSWHTATAASNTTTYAITVADIPGGANSGFEAMMYLIPENGMSSPDGASVDWDSANVAYFTINANANGTGKGNFRYKTNCPQAENFQSWTDLTCTNGPLGTWQLTFNNNTNVTITAPDNSSTSFTIPDDAAANFQGNLIAYFGVRPGDATRIGQSATFGRIKITGAAGVIDDNFVSSGPPYDLNPATWVRKASNPQGIFVTGSDVKYWVSWPQPDFGFTNLYASDNLTNKLASSQWKVLPTSGTGWKNVAGTKRLTIIDQPTLNSSFGYNPSNCFFGLYHP